MVTASKTLINMPHSKLLWRLYLGYLAIFMMTSLIIGVLVSKQINEYSLHEIEGTLAARVELLAEISKHYLTDPGNSDLADALQRTITRLDENTQSRLTIITRDGRVLADSREAPQDMDNHLGRPEIIDAKTHGTATITRYSQTLEQNMMYLALRVVLAGETIGFVRVSKPLSIIDAKLAQLRTIILLAAVTAAIVALLMGYYFARRFTIPLTKITEHAKSISQGEFDKRITVLENNEIGTLAEAINRMARNAAQRVSEITADRNRLAEIFAGMVEGVIGVDEQQNIIHINQAAAELLGLSMTASIQKPLWQEVRVQEITLALEQAIKKQDVVRSQMRRLSEQGDLVVDIYAAALHDSRGEAIGAVIVLHDISEVDQLERVRRDFVANASHELKTPITAIRGLTETILDDDQMDSDTRQRFTEKIHTQSLRLSALVSDLMTLSRLDSDRDTPSQQSYDLGGILRLSVSAARPACLDKGLELTLELPDKKLGIVCDQQAISQMLDNLIDNALKYTPPKNKIDVSLSLEREHAVIKIHDTGIGIGPQYQSRIFERFYRVDKARSRDLGGTGLGLSIVKNIVEQHGGEILLNSQLESGSTFTIRLPLNT